jgi:hypothetical protein
LARKRPVRGPREQGSGSVGHQGSGPGIEHPVDDRHRLQRQKGLGVAAVEARRDAIAHLACLGRALVPTQCIGEQQSGCKQGCVVAGRRHRLFELILPARLAGSELDQAKLEREC